MDTFKVSCQEVIGKSFNYVINGQDHMFMGGKPSKINVAVWDYIKGKKNSKGKPLFVKEVAEGLKVSSKEEISEREIVEDKVEETPKFSVLDLKPPVKKVTSQNKSFKSLTKKVQGKLT
jgi:hypothetical protein